MNLLENAVTLCFALAVCTFFNIRRSTPDDAEGILHAHYSAVHETAKIDYSEQVLNVGAHQLTLNELPLVARRSRPIKA